MMHNPESKLCLTMCFNRYFANHCKSERPKFKARLACRMGAKRLLYEALALRKTNAGMMLKQVREINAMAIYNKEDFGVQCHTTTNEPYFYETAYKYNCLKSHALIDKHKRAIVQVDGIPSKDEFVYNTPISIDESGIAHMSATLGLNKW